MIWFIRVCEWCIIPLLLFLMFPPTNRMRKLLIAFAAIRIGESTVGLYRVFSAALQEDADVIGLSILSGAHNHIAPRLMALLKEKAMDDVLVVIGGIIPEADIPKLQEIGQFRRKRGIERGAEPR